MCLGPEILIPTLLTAGSTVLNSLANRKVEKKQDKITNYYRQRNTDRQKLAMEEAAMARDKYRNPNEQIGGQADERDILDTQPAPGQDVDFAGSAPSALKSDIARKIVESVEKGKAQSRALNKVNAYGDVFFDAGLEGRRSADKIGMYGDFTRGDTDTMDFEMSQSPRAGKSLNTIADVFGLAGMGSNLYFATNPLAGAGKAINPGPGPLSTMRKGLLPGGNPQVPFNQVPFAR